MGTRWRHAAAQEQTTGALQSLARASTTASRYTASGDATDDVITRPSAFRLASTRPAQLRLLGLASPAAVESTRPALLASAEASDAGADDATGPAGRRIKYKDNPSRAGLCSDPWLPSRAVFRWTRRVQVGRGRSRQDATLVSERAGAGASLSASGQARTLCLFTRLLNCARVESKTDAVCRVHVTARPPWRLQAWEHAWEALASSRSLPVVV